ncbi:MAG TPA: hypothetical protein VIX84_23030, partial [Acidimicrobiales bacterium]
MRGKGRLRLQLGFPLLGLAALALASCGGGPAAPRATGTTVHHGATTTTTAATTTTTAATATAPSLPPVATTGPLTVSAPVE